MDKLDRLERKLDEVLRRLKALQEDVVHIDPRGTRPFLHGDVVTCVRPYKRSMPSGKGSVQNLNSWYWQVKFRDAILHIPKSQASKFLERQ